PSRPIEIKGGAGLRARPSPHHTHRWPHEGYRPPFHPRMDYALSKTRDGRARRPAPLNTSTAPATFFVIFVFFVVKDICRYFCQRICESLPRCIPRNGSRRLPP